MYRSIGFDDLGMEDTNNNDATEDNSIPINGYILASATSVVTFF